MTIKEFEINKQAVFNTNVTANYAPAILQENLDASSRIRVKLPTPVTIDFSLANITLPGNTDISINFTEGLFVENYGGSNQTPFPELENVFSFNIPLATFLSSFDLEVDLGVFKYNEFFSEFSTSIEGDKISFLSSNLQVNCNLILDEITIIKPIELGTSVSTTASPGNDFARSTVSSDSYYALASDFIIQNNFQGGIEIYNKNTDAFITRVLDPNQNIVDSVKFADGPNIALNDNLLAVGSRSENKVDVFETNNFLFDYQITSPTLSANTNRPPGSNDFEFGAIVATDGTRIVVSNFEDDTVLNEGKVYVFSASNGNLLFQIDNPDPNPTDQSEFGNSISILDDKILIGHRRRGAAYIYSAVNGALLETFTGGTSFGRTVQLTDSYAIINSLSTLSIYNISDGSLVKTISGESGTMSFGFNFVATDNFIVAVAQVVGSLSDLRISYHDIDTNFSYVFPDVLTSNRTISIDSGQYYRFLSLVDNKVLYSSKGQNEAVFFNLSLV